MEIKDSGERRLFLSGAVRDIQVGKGRCDLLPLDVVAEMIDVAELHDTLYAVYQYTVTKDINQLVLAVQHFCRWRNWSVFEAMREVAIHYEGGAVKYGEHNWEKGIPVHCYIDSGIRHLLKCADGLDDEPHDRAFVWNMLGAMWTTKHHPYLFDIEIPQ